MSEETENFTLSTDFVLLENEKTGNDDDYRTMLSESEPSGYLSNLQQPRLDANKVRVSYLIGDRGGGKTTAMEEDAESYYNEGFAVWYIWGSRSNENVFVAVNNNCKYKWDKRRENIEKKLMLAPTQELREKYQKQLEELDSRLHCNCSEPYPVNWLVPEYWEFDGIDDYNTCWSGIEEYQMALEREWIMIPLNELTLKQREKLINRKLKKPKYLIKTDLIRVCPFRIPINAKDKEIFEQQFLKYAFEARKEHRWLVLNPLMFIDEKHKFATIGHIFDRLKFWMDAYFQPNTPVSVAKLHKKLEPVPRSEWSKLELSYDKVCLVLPEIRTLAPPHTFSPEKQSTLAKRPLIDILPELRHFRLWLLGDLQAYDDLNSSVRPMADYVVIKRGTKELLGPEWSAFVNKIEQLRKERLIAISHGKFDDFKKAPYELKSVIDKDLPSVAEIPKNKGYIVYRNGEFYLEHFGMAKFHHKTENQTLQSMTGITWKLNTSNIADVPNVAEIDKSSKKLKNNDEERVMKYLTKEYIKNNYKWPIAQTNYNKEIQEGRLPMTRFTTMTKEVLSNSIGRIEYLKSVIKFAKQHKDKPVEELTKGLD